MRRLALFALVLALVGSGCASLGVKQQTVVSLQASEAALEAGHDIERGLCFVSPATETGPHCTSPLAASVALTDLRHQQLATLFSHAFGLEITAATALQAWRAGDPAPTDLAGYLKDVSDILALAQQLAPGASGFLTKAQLAVDEAGKIAVLVGVK